MVTNRIDMTKLTTCSIAMMWLMLLCTVRVDHCVAAEFGFLAAQVDNETKASANSDNAAKPAAELGSDFDQAEIDEDQREYGQAIAAPMPEIANGKFQLPSLTALTTELSQIGNGRTPENYWEGKQGNLQPLPEGADDRGRPWNWSTVNWAPTNTFTYPLYFQDRMLERHGQEYFGHLQPLASGARFATNIVMLPYLMAVDNPCECQYTLGYYRSGSPTPVMLQRPPLQRRAVINEALWMGGVIAVFP